MAKKNVHVVPSGNRWAVKPEGTAKPLSTHLTQQAAADAGRKVAKQNQSELVIHRPSSMFRRVARSMLRFDVPHREQPRWHVQRSRYSASIKARYRRDGFRPTAFQSNTPPLPKRISLDFELETNVPKPFTVHWQVVNTGNEAYRAGQLRGDFYDSSSSGRSRTESTKFSGMHWVEGFVVKDGVCVARTGEFVVNIA